MATVSCSASCPLKNEDTRLWLQYTRCSLTQAPRHRVPLAWQRTTFSSVLVLDVSLPLFLFSRIGTNGAAESACGFHEFGHSFRNCGLLPTLRCKEARRWLDRSIAYLLELRHDQRLSVRAACGRAWRMGNIDCGHDDKRRRGNHCCQTRAASEERCDLPGL
jgi:hypothetical protein